MKSKKRELFKAEILKAMGFQQFNVFEEAVTEKSIYETWINTWIDVLFEKNISIHSSIQQLFDLRRQLYLGCVQL